LIAAAIAPVFIYTFPTMIRKIFVIILLLAFIDNYAIGQGSPPEAVYLFQLKPSGGATAENCFLPQFENAKASLTFTSNDTLARLEKFIEDEFPVLEVDCFFPNLKIVHKNFTYVLSTYCGVIHKFKNTAPYQTSNIKLANDFIFTESLIAYFINLEKKFFSDAFFDFYQGIISKIPSASNMYSHSLELFPTIGKEAQSEPNFKDMNLQPAQNTYTPAIKTNEDDKPVPERLPIENQEAEKRKALITESKNPKDAANKISAAVSAENEKLIVSLPQIVNPYRASITKTNAPIFFSEPTIFIAPLQPDDFLLQARFETEGPLALTLQEGSSAQNSPIQMAAIGSGNKIEKTSSSSLVKGSIPQESFSAPDNLNLVPQEKQLLEEMPAKDTLLQNASLAGTPQESMKVKALEDSTVHKPLKSLLPWFSPNKMQEVNYNYAVVAKPDLLPVDANFNVLPALPKPKEQGLSLPEKPRREIISIEPAAKPTLTSPLSTSNSNAKENNATLGVQTVAVAPQPTPVNIAATGAAAVKPAPAANVAPPSLSKTPTAIPKQAKPTEDDDLEAEDDPTKNIEEESEEEDTEDGDLSLEELEAETSEESMEELDSDLEEDMEEDSEDEDSEDEDF
jgi:hypothetical protein